MSTRNVKVTKNADTAQHTNKEDSLQGNPPAAAQGQEVPVETKADKFRRLAVSRTGKAIAAVKNLIPLSNKSNYEFSAEQVKRICGALADAIGDVAKAFTMDRAAKTEFQL